MSSLPGPEGRCGRGLLRAALDLVLPEECGGCGRAGTRWCAECAALFAREPWRVRPRVAVGSPVYALAPYASPAGIAVVALKERGRRDLAAPLGAALAEAIGRLRRAGELDPPELAPLVLVPAPTRGRAASRRGGDPVSRVAAEAAALLARDARETAVVWEALRTTGPVVDSVGLSVSQRARNLRGRVRLRGLRRPADGACVVLVDDVVTTGSTLAETVSVLRTAGVRPAAAVALTRA